MIDLKAYAVRKDGVIHVDITGYLLTSCYTASIKDKYPGGHIHYFVDPGNAQIFIEEIYRQSAGVCILREFPWVAHVSITDRSHSTVAIYVNDSEQIIVPIKDEPKEFRVIAISGFNPGTPNRCSIIPADAPYPAIYSSYFGPATKAECEAWCKTHCV